MVKVHLIIEGASKESASLQIELRKAFHLLLKKSGIITMPRIIAAGGLTQAYDRFRTMVENGDFAILLVDSEKNVPDQYKGKPWDFLKTFESWNWLNTLENNQCHLMVQCMESWFFADKQCLENYYGSGFNRKKLQQRPIEELSKDTIFKSLNDAAKGCKNKKDYQKGRDSFKILMLLDPQRIQTESFWARRFIATLHDILDAE